MTTRVLVAYATSTGCDSSCAIDIATQIATVPELDVDVQPMARVGSLAPYAALYVGWVHPSAAGERELGRFLTSNAALLPSRPIWIVHLHPGCGHAAGRGEMKMTRLVAHRPVREPQGLSDQGALNPVPAARRVGAAPRRQPVGQTR